MKRKYEKPSITKVELRPEEAVLTGCKTTACHTGWGSKSSCVACTS